MILVGIYKEVIYLTLCRIRKLFNYLAEVDVGRVKQAGNLPLQIESKWCLLFAPEVLSMN
jgi:hypothetical protein